MIEKPNQQTPRTYTTKLVKITIERPEAILKIAFQEKSQHYMLLEENHILQTCIAKYFLSLRNTQYFQKECDIQENLSIMHLPLKLLKPIAQMVME